MKRLRSSVIRWLVVALLCLLLGFLLGKFKLDILTEQFALMSVDLQANKLLQDELALVNNKLFFYERVIAPELDSSGVKIYSFEVAKNAQANQWEYQLVLTQSQKNRRFLKGKFTITLSVFEEGKLQQIPLSRLSENISDSFKFKYFQTIDGVFSLPDTVTVDEVIIKLNVAGNRWNKAQRLEERYDWRVLSAKNSGELSEFDNNENDRD